MKIAGLKDGGTAVRAHCRGALYALLLTLTCILLFSLAVKYAGIPETAIKPVNQVIKALSVCAGVYAVLRTVQKRAWLHGGLLGLVYTCLAFLALSVIDRNFGITEGFFAEAAFALIVGIVSAILLRLRKRDF